MPTINYYPYGGNPGSMTVDPNNPTGNKVSVAYGIGNTWNQLNGTAANNAFNAAEAEKARLFNSAEAERQRDWETMMSNTAYQRAAEDMRAAGINPASLGGNAAGSTASTPSGASATGAAAHGNVSGSSGLLGLVMQGIGMALRSSVARSALSYKEGSLDLRRFEANSRAAFRAASIADKEANTALKKAKDYRDYEYQKFKLEGKAMHTDLEEQRFYNTQLKNEILRRHLKKRQG